MKICTEMSFTWLPMWAVVLADTVTQGFHFYSKLISLNGLYVNVFFQPRKCAEQFNDNASRFYEILWYLGLSTNAPSISTHIQPKHDFVQAGNLKALIMVWIILRWENWLYKHLWPCVYVICGVSSQGEVFIPLKLQVSTALACFFGFTGQSICSHLNKGAEPRVAVWRPGRLRLCGNHWAYKHTHSKVQELEKEHIRKPNSALVIKNGQKQRNQKRKPMIWHVHLCFWLHKCKLKVTFQQHKFLLSAFTPQWLWWKASFCLTLTIKQTIK